MVTRTHLNVTFIRTLPVVFISDTFYIKRDRMTHTEFNHWTLKGNTLRYLTDTSKETPEDSNSEVNPRPMS